MDLEERTEKIQLLSVPGDAFTFKVKNNNRRMKVYIKMTKEETKYWSDIRDAAKPENVTDDEFARVIFFRGMQTFMDELVQRINTMSEEEKSSMLEDAGVAPEAIEKVKVSAGSEVEEESDANDSDA